jgi:hypothetical protein
MGGLVYENTRRREASAVLVEEGVKMLIRMLMCGEVDLIGPTCGRERGGRGRDRAQRRWEISRQLRG